MTSDYALQWCEEQILASNHFIVKKNLKLPEFLLEYIENQDIVSKISTYFEEIKLEKGEYLFKRNERGEDIYYLEEGQLTVILEKGSGRRLRTIGAGNFVGEMAAYTDFVRTATIIAEEDCILKKLTYQNLQKMHTQDADLVAALDKVIINILAKRLDYSNQKLAILVE